MPNEHLLKIIDDLDELSSHEKGMLVGMLEERWHVEVPKALEGMRPENPLELIPLQESFSVVLTGHTSKIEAIKVVRQILGLDLKAAKEFVESAPKTIKEDVSRDEADSIAGQVRSSGGLVEVR